MWRLPLITNAIAAIIISILWLDHASADTIPLAAPTFTGNISITYSVGFDGDVTGSGSQTQNVNGPTGVVQYPSSVDPGAVFTTGALASVNFNNGLPNVNSGWPVLTVTTNTSAQPPDGGTASAVATMQVQYNFVISGPAGGLVPIYVGASGLATGPGGEAFFQLYDSGGVAVLSPSQASWSISGFYNLQADEIYTVEMIAGSEAGAVSGPGCPGLCVVDNEATIDPTFYIDPNFSSASEYSLTFSPGINTGSVPTTPLPATLPLFCTGLGALGLLGWRRKRARIRLS